MLFHFSEPLTSDMLGMVADTATNLIERPVSGFWAVLWAFTAFILLTTTSRVAPRVASFTTCTWKNNKLGFRNNLNVQQSHCYVGKINHCISLLIWGGSSQSLPWYRTRTWSTILFWVNIQYGISKYNAEYIFKETMRYYDVCGQTHWPHR